MSRMVKIQAEGGWFFIKTPHVVELYLGSDVAKYNPKTGEHEKEEQLRLKVPSYVSLMDKGKQFAEYGSRDREIIIVRFNNRVPEFNKLMFDGKIYRLVEHTQAKDKRAYRMEKVAR